MQRYDFSARLSYVYLYSLERRRLTADFFNLQNYFGLVDVIISYCSLPTATSP